LSRKLFKNKYGKASGSTLQIQHLKHHKHLKQYKLLLLQKREFDDSVTAMNDFQLLMN
jgi:hypothetical protein